MNDPGESNRRTFLQVVGAASLSILVPAKAASGTNRSLRGFAFIGSFGHADRDHIEVFRIEDSRWTHVQRIASQAPAALLTHPSGRFFYAANRVSADQGLPRGTVEVFSIHEQSGTLSQIQRQPLSLSGTKPRDLAISSDGRSLVVAIGGGGAYNVLPIAANGMVGNAKAIFKETGGGLHRDLQSSAHPHTLFYDKHGRFLLTSDFGCDHLSVFAFKDSALQRNSKLTLPSGSGPGSMVLHPGGTLLYVRHELSSMISCHAYQPSEGVIEKAFQFVPLPPEALNHELPQKSLWMEAQGRYLYAASANRTTVWAIDPTSGTLSLEREAGTAQVEQLFEDKRFHLMFGRRSGFLRQMRVGDEISSNWTASTQVAEVNSPVSLALLPRDA